jgi:phosphoglycolate phosphatase
LIDTAPDLADAVNSMLQTLGRRELPEASIRSFIGDGVEQLIVRALSASQKQDPSDAAYVAGALTTFKGIYGQQLFRRSRVYAGVPATLSSLAQSGLTLCCVTNKESSLAVPLLEIAGLSQYLAFTRCPEQASERKPSPAMLIAACARLNIEPTELLFVGDSTVDVRAGLAAGCQVVAVSYGYDSRLDHMGNRVIGRLSELLENPEAT